MPSDPTDSTSTNLPSEPFGQTGVRQHLRVLVNSFFITMLIVACLLWYQSHQYYARFEWRGESEQLHITSVYGRIRIDGVRYAQPVHTDSGWSFRTGRIRQAQDGWKDSVWKRIGIEFSLTPDVRAREGFWVRIKWSFVIILCGVILSIRLLFQWWRQRQGLE